MNGSSARGVGAGRGDDEGTDTEMEKPLLPLNWIIISCICITMQESQRNKHDEYFRHRTCHAHASTSTPDTLDTLDTLIMRQSSATAHNAALSRHVLSPLSLLIVKCF